MSHSTHPSAQQGSARHAALTALPLLPGLSCCPLPSVVSPLDSRGWSTSPLHCSPLFSPASSSSFITCPEPQACYALSPSVQASFPSLAPVPQLLTAGPPLSLSSPHSLWRSAAGSGDETWHCSLGCGTRYERSSGRSIRRHMTACFIAHWPGGDTLSEAEVQAVMCAEQESGHLVTGLRRWRRRQRQRSSLELSAAETWTCPRRCGQVYRVSSSRSIQKHLTGCTARPAALELAGSGDDDSEPSASASHAAGHKVEIALLAGGMPAEAQADGAEELREDDWYPLPESDAAAREPFQYESGCEAVLSPRSILLLHPVSASVWEESPLRLLLRRHQLEAEQLSGRQFREIVALRQLSDTSSGTSLPQPVLCSSLHLRRPAG